MSLVSYCKLRSEHIEHTAVKVDDNLEASSASPADGLVEVLKLTINVLIAIKALNSPVSNRDSDVVHSSTCDLVEVIGSNEAAPVLCQNTTTLVLTQGFTKGPLINCSISSCIEDRRSNPGL